MSITRTLFYDSKIVLTDDQICNLGKDNKCVIGVSRSKNVKDEVHTIYEFNW